MNSKNKISKTILSMKFCTSCKKYLASREFGKYKTCQKCREKKINYAKNRATQVARATWVTPLQIGGTTISSSIEIPTRLKQIEGMEIPLSTSDLIECMPNELKDIMIHKYCDLEEYNDIDELLEPTGCCILLFETDRDNGTSYGHWTCLVKTVTEDNDPSINFFDSYGIIPDNEKRKINPEFLDLSNQSRNILSKFLYDASKNYSIIEYNEKRFQKLSPLIATCGRFCIMRIWLRNLSMNGFQNFIEKLKKEFNLTGDELVTKLTNLVLNEGYRPEDIINNLLD